MLLVLAGKPTDASFILIIDKIVIKMREQNETLFI